MIKGWKGKRLRIDLSLQKAWSVDIPATDLRQWLGGRGLNASFFNQNFRSPISPSSPENPIAFAVGPLTGSLAPCSGWTSIASFSPLFDFPSYAFTRMAGHFGVPLKAAGYDQLILQGKADRPVYLWIDNGGVKFEKAASLWGKETIETTVAIQEEKGDRNIEVLCIGPAGEKQLPFSNVIHRLSWTGDHLGLGYVFGVKQLKAIAIRGKKPVTLHDPQQFLNLCLKLKDRIQKDQRIQKVKEEGTFSLLGGEDGVMIKNGNSWASPDPVKQWSASLKTYLSGQESCFSCPAHCGSNIQHQDGTFGGIHLEKAWHLGPKIGVVNGEWTLKLHRLCLTQGLDPFLTGSVLSHIMEVEKNHLLPDQHLRQIYDIGDQGEKAWTLLRRILDGKGNEFPRSTHSFSQDEDFDILTDILPFCRTVVNRLNLETVSNMTDLIHAATGHALSKEDLRNIVWNIRGMEASLQNHGIDLKDESSLPHLSEGQISKILRKENRINESIIHPTTS